MTDDHKADADAEIVLSDSEDNESPTELEERLIGAEDQRPEPDNEDG